MRPDHVSIVRSTWQLVSPHAAAIGLLFYDRLFELDPSLRRLFAASVGPQTEKLMQTFAVAVAALDRLEAIAPTLELLGRRHARAGVRDGDYDTVGRALLDTLAWTFGARFTDEVRTAWAETYAALAGTMRRAAAAATESAAAA
jgi:hemoglobin-like flavoprotein